MHIGGQSKEYFSAIHYGQKGGLDGYLAKLRLLFNYAGEDDQEILNVIEDIRRWSGKGGSTRLQEKQV